MRGNTINKICLLKKPKNPDQTSYLLDNIRKSAWMVSMKQMTTFLVDFVINLSMGSTNPTLIDRQKNQASRSVELIWDVVLIPPNKVAQLFSLSHLCKTVNCSSV